MVIVEDCDVFMCVDVINVEYGYWCDVFVVDGGVNGGVYFKMVELDFVICEY